MTDKQKEAIETLFHLEHINGYVDLYKEHNVIIKSDVLLKWKNATKTVLDLIQEQQKDISTYQKTIEDTLKIIEDNEVKDKIIDEMAEEISKSIVNTCPFADYNVDLDCENKCQDNYKECWKQYFERKVEE